MARSRSRRRPTVPSDPFRQRLSKRMTRLPEDSTEPCVRVQTLGAARVMFGEYQMSLASGLQLSLLVRLLYSPGFSVGRDDLLHELWPGHSDLRQRGNLRQLLYKLRTMGLRVALVGDQVRLDRAQVEPMFCLERSVELFERDVIRGDEPFGTFLPGLASPSDAWAAWFDQTREAVHADVRRVLVTQLRRRRERGDWTGAEVLSRWLLQFDPLNEDATLTIAECTMMNGAKSEAVAILDRYIEELGPQAGDIRLPAAQLRKRFTEPSARRRPSLAATERHFIGREKEMAELTMQMRRARWHDGSAILLHGPAGIGKTRLCTELGKVAQIEGYREITIECRESEQHRPLGVVLEALPELLASPGALGCSPESLSLLKRLVGEEVGGLGEAELPTDSAGSTQFKALEDIDAVLRTLRSQSVRNALVDLWGAVSHERPIYLHVDDVQWIDDASWEVFSDLFKRTHETRILAVLTSRASTVRDGLPRKLPPKMIVQRLEPLCEDDCQKLARAIGKDLAAELSEEVEGWIISSGDGTPLLLRALVEHWVVTGDASVVPPTLTSLLEQRLDRLNPAALRALQLITILGRTASLERIRAILEMPTHDVLDAFERLEESGCLARSDATLVVSHDLVAKTASHRLSRLSETTLRSAAARHFESEYHEKGDSQRLVDALANLVISNSPTDVMGFIQRHEKALWECGSPVEIIGSLDVVGPATDPQAQQTISRLKSRLELEAGEYRLALGGAAGTLLLSPSMSGVSEAQAEEMLSLIDSAFRADEVVDRDHLAAICSSIVEQSHFSPSARLRASTIGITICANTCDREMASRCYSPLQRLMETGDAGDAAARTALVYNAIFGDITVAERVARRILDGIESGRPSTQRTIDCGRAAFTLRLCGYPDDARRAFIRQHELAVALHTPRLAEFPVWQLALIALDRGDTSELAHWNREIERLCHDHFDPIAGSFLVAHRARCAIEVGDLRFAERNLELACSYQPRFPTVKATAYLVALELGIALLRTGEAVNPALIQAGIEKHKRTAQFGTSDYLSAVLARAIGGTGSTEEAREFLSNYVSGMRRERGELPLALVKAFESL